MASTQSGENILVPIDFTKHSEKALLHGAQIAEALSMRLIILHVVHDPAEYPGYYIRRGLKKLTRRIEDHAQDMMDSYIEEIRTKYQDIKAIKHAEIKMVVGLPVTRILEVAESLDSFIIIMGSKGRRGFPKILLGSNAEKVLRLSKIPVTIIK